ncbi:MAG: DUF5916 domain-containing protein [Pseudomonadota bacterium]|nr:DUF5916 domain-containing protein [Pseudomonadota bacterium]
MPLISRGAALEAMYSPINSRLSLAELASATVWNRAEIYTDFVEKMPVNGAQPDYKTSVQLIYDDAALYIRIRAHDDQPQNVKWRRSSHDTIDPHVEDCVTVLIDPVGSRKSAQFFRVNAVGSTEDGMYTAENDLEDFGPDFDFEAYAAPDPYGYTALLKIPFTTLRYTADGSANWRIIVNRWIPRDKIIYLVSAAIPDTVPHQLATMQELHGMAVPSRQFLQLRPSVTGLISRETTPGTAAVSDTSMAGSLDIKWRPTAKLILDATVNPDFSQVELDVPQLTANKKFALSLKEKRSFFQESSDLWQAPALSLYTRSVTSPEGGLRLTQRSESWAGTVFLSKDRGGGQVIIPEPYGTDYADQPSNSVGTVRFRFDEKGSHVGLVVSDREYGMLGYNHVAGADVNSTWDDHYQFRGQWLTSQTTALGTAAGQLQAGRTQIGQLNFAELTRRGDNSLFSISAKDITAKFRDDAAFSPQNDAREFSLDANAIKHNVGNFNEVWLYASGDEVVTHTDGRLISDSLRPGIYWRHANGTELTFEPRVMERMRASPSGSLIRERYGHVEIKANPNYYLATLQFSLDLGNIADVIEERVTHGHGLHMIANCPLSRDTEISVQYDREAAGFLRSSYFSEDSMSLVARKNFTGQLFLRVIAQSYAYRRNSTPEAPTLASKNGNDSGSVVFGWRKSHGESLYLGVSLATQRAGAVSTKSQSEIFVKYQTDLGSAWSELTDSVPTR